MNLKQKPVIGPKTGAKKYQKKDLPRFWTWSILV